MSFSKCNWTNIWWGKVFWVLEKRQHWEKNCAGFQKNCHRSDWVDVLFILQFFDGSFYFNQDLSLMIQKYVQISWQQLRKFKMMSLNKSEIRDWSWEKLDFHVILTSSNLDEKEQIGVLFFKEWFCAVWQENVVPMGFKGIDGS